MSEHTVHLNVGDKLAFKPGHYGEWYLETIRKITPSGRLVTDGHTLEPNLRVRGRNYNDPYKATPVTQAILDAIERREITDILIAHKWVNLTLDQLRRMRDIVTEGQPTEGTTD